MNPALAGATHGDPAPASNRRDPATVLVIEDDASLGHLLVELFRSEGMNAKYCDQYEAAQCIKDLTPDCVVLDYVMGDIDGAEIARQARACPETASIPIVLITAFAHGEEVAQAAGIDFFLPKPFDLEVLLHCIDTALGHR